MARRSLDQAMEQYKSNAGSEFFQLENDKDVAVVRFLHEGDELVENEDWFIVHEVEVDGKKRWMHCPETSDCPGCDRLGKARLKIFLQLVEKGDPDKRKLWERGHTFGGKIKELISKYGDLCNRAYEIERNGKKGDRNTSYDLFPMDRDDIQLSDIPVERQKLLDGKEGFILELTHDEMHDAIDGRLRLPRTDREDRGSRERDRGGRDGGRDSGYRGRDREDRGGRDRGREDRGRGDRRSSDGDRGRDREDRGRRDDREDRGRDDRGADRSRERSRDDRDDRSQESSSERRRPKSGDDMF